MSVLYIYDGNEEVGPSKVSPRWTYSKNLGKVLGGGEEISNVDLFNDWALKLRDDYIRFVYSTRTLFTKHGLTHEGHSFYFLSDYSCKRSEFFATYPDLCHLKLIEARLPEIPSKIIFHSCDQKFIKLIQSKFPSAVFESLYPKESHPFNFLYIRHWYFFVTGFFKILTAKSVNLSIPKVSIGKLYLTRYPLHLKENLYEDKYVDLPRSNDRFLVNILTDGYHQNLTFSNYKSALQTLRAYTPDRVIILDQFLHLRDFFRYAVLGTWWLIKFKKVMKEKFLFQGVDLSPYIQDELSLSALRIPRLFLYKNALQDLNSSVKAQELVYYLHEYSFGRAVTSFVRNRLPWKTVGFQHGPSAQRKMLYFMAKGEAQEFGSPDEILAEDQASKDIYELAGYTNVKLMGRVRRLHYLEKVKRDHVDVKTSLAVAGLHDGLFLYRELKQTFKMNPDRKYLLRLHPRANSELIFKELNQDGLKNVEIDRGDLTERLSTVGEVIVTYSSVGYEAHLKGIPVRVVRLRGKIDESPLSDLKKP